MSSAVVHVVAGFSAVRGIRTTPVASGSMYCLVVGWLLEYPSGKIFRLHSYYGWKKLISINNNYKTSSYPSSYYILVPGIQWAINELKVVKLIATVHNFHNFVQSCILLSIIIRLIVLDKIVICTSISFLCPPLYTTGHTQGLLSPEISSFKALSFLSLIWNVSTSYSARYHLKYKVEPLKFNIKQVT